jgi:hypothetical protein
MLFIIIVASPLIMTPLSPILKYRHPEITESDQGKEEDEMCKLIRRSLL